MATAPTPDTLSMVSWPSPCPWCSVPGIMATLPAPDALSPVSWPRTLLMMQCPRYHGRVTGPNLLSPVSWQCPSPWCSVSVIIAVTSPLMQRPLTSMQCPRYHGWVPNPNPVGSNYLALASPITRLIIFIKSKPRQDFTQIQEKMQKN